MGYIRLVLEAFGIFVVSIFVLFVVNMLTSPRNVATGVAVLHEHGLVLLTVGLFYVAFGIFLWSPSSEWVLRRLLGV